MKFLCVECDESMQLLGAEGPHEGAMTVVFECSNCGKKTAMLTNPMETQMVRSLGVNIGGRSTSTEPMEMLNGALAESVAPEYPSTDTRSGETATGSKCPFTGMINDAYAQPASTGIPWTVEAEERMGRIPSFARTMVRKSIEQHARENGYRTIDVNVVDEIKGWIGM